MHARWIRHEIPLDARDRQSDSGCCSSCHLCAAISSDVLCKHMQCLLYSWHIFLRSQARPSPRCFIDALSNHCSSIVTYRSSGSEGGKDGGDSLHGMLICCVLYNNKFIRCERDRWLYLSHNISFRRSKSLEIIWRTLISPGCWSQRSWWRPTRSFIRQEFYVLPPHVCSEFRVVGKKASSNTTGVVV